MSASTLTTFAAFIKTEYTPDKVEDLTQSEHPLFAMMSKSEDGGGDGEVVPLLYSNPQGIAVGLADSQASKGNVKGQKFTLTYGDYSGSVDIGLKVLRASRTNMGAFFANKEAEINGLTTQFGDDMSLMCWGNGGNAIGQVAASGVSGETATLMVPADIANFELDMYVQCSANDGSDPSHTVVAGSTYVTALDQVNGIVTFEDLSDAGIANSYYLFRYGCFYGNTGNWVMAGVQAFVASSETPPALYGMTAAQRLTNPVKLAGCRVPAADVAGRSFEERASILGSRMTGRYKARGMDKMFWHPEDWQTLEIGLRGQGYRSLTDSTTKFGFQTIESTIGNRVVRHYADMHCPKGTAFLLRMNSWKIKSMGALIGPVEEDGLTIVRKATTNDFEYRLVSFPAMVCNAPRDNGRVAVA